VCYVYLGMSNGYIKNDHEEAFYRTPENVGTGNCALTITCNVVLIYQGFSITVYDIIFLFCGF